MPTPQKAAVVDELQEKLGRAASVIMADYRGMSVATLTDLRRQLGQVDVELRVAKNTLTLLAAKRLGVTGLEPILQGPTTLAISYGDPAVPAKKMAEFARAHKELVVKGGILEGSVLSAEEVKTLADLPSREVLLARVAGGMNAPLTAMVSVLAAPLRSLAYGLKALEEKQAAESA